MSLSKENIKSVLELLFYASASALLFASVFGVFLCPAPILFIFVKRGKVPALITFILAALASLLIVKNPVSLFYTLGIGSYLASIIYLTEKGGGEKHISISEVFIKSSIVLSCAALIIIASTTRFNFSKFSTQLETYIEETQKKLVETSMLTKKISENDEFQNLIKSSPQYIAGHFLTQLPGYMFSFLFFTAFLNIFLFRKWKNTVFSKKEKLTLWKAPEILIWFAIISLVPIVLHKTQLVPISTNILRVLSFFYFLQGLAVLSFILARRNISFLIQCLFIALLSFTLIPLPTDKAPFSNLWLNIPMLIGFADTWLDFRKRLISSKMSLRG